MNTTLNQMGWVITSIARQIQHQKDTPMHVSYLFNAYLYMVEFSHMQLDAAFIQQLAKIACPNIINNHMYRTVPVSFDGIVGGAKPEHIARQMNLLLQMQNDMTPEEFYQRFQEIHPFQDGNGRIGFLLYSFLKNRKEDVENGHIHLFQPPEFKK